VVWQNQSQIFSGGVFFPPSLTGSDVIAGSQNTTQLAALSRSDGTLKWQTVLPQSGEVAAAAVFGGLVWALAQPSSGGSVQAVAIGALTGHRLFATQSYADDTQGFPPVVSAGHAYVNLGSQVLVLALPGSSRPPGQPLANPRGSIAQTHNTPVGPGTSARANTRVTTWTRRASAENSQRPTSSLP